MSVDRGRPATWLLLGMAIALAVAIVAALLVTRTESGRERVLGYTLAALGGGLNGTLEVERLDGNLFTGARLYGISLRGPDGDPLLLADSAYVNYEVPTFLGGDVVINELVLYDADVLLRRLPTDTLWNYQEILSNPEDTTSGPPRATLIEQARLVNARIVVRLPWEPDEALSPEARAREVETALADTSRLDVVEVEGGLLQTMRFAVADALVSELVIAPDERGGTYLRIEDLEGEARVWRDPPLRILGLRGELGLREGVVRYRADSVELPDSRLTTAGVVDLTGEELAYDLVFASDDVALADLQWLYPPIPDEGRGAVRLAMETRPEGLLFHARDLDVRAPDTHVTGRFGMVLGDTLRFHDVDLQADPLDVDTVERMLPAGLPVEGLRIGSAEIRGAAE